MRNIRKTSNAIQHQDTWGNCERAAIGKIATKIAMAFLLIAIFSVCFVSCDESKQEMSVLRQELQRRNEIIHQQEIMKFILITIVVIGFFVGVGIGSKALKDSRKYRKTAKGDTYEQE
jgi:uncharacterized membrane protein